MEPLVLELSKLTNERKTWLSQYTAANRKTRGFLWIRYLRRLRIFCSSL